MAPIIAGIAKVASNVALNLIMKLLTEKFLKKFLRELILYALKKYSDKTETKLDDQLYVMVQEAFAEEDPK